MDPRLTSEHASSSRTKERCTGSTWIKKSSLFSHQCSFYAISFQRFHLEQEGCLVECDMRQLPPQMWKYYPFSLFFWKRSSVKRMVQAGILKGAKGEWDAQFPLKMPRNWMPSSIRFKKKKILALVVLDIILETPRCPGTVSLNTGRVHSAFHSLRYGYFHAICCMLDLKDPMMLSEKRRVRQ